jgi:nucleotidyltransferase/DNA polymerase involved in DNA repair
MPSVVAERLCPQALWLPGRMDLYVRVSRRIRRVLDDWSPLVEPLSIDEAFLDLTGIAAGLDAGREAAASLKERIRKEERLTASVGVAPNKFLAKVASDLEKPDGLVVLAHESVRERLWPLPVERLWGVGPATARLLRERAVRTVGDVARVSEQALASVVGPATAAHLRALARGEDERPVVAERAAKSISEERTYGTDLTDPAEIDRALLARAEGVARELRKAGLAGRVVRIKVRTGDYTTWTRAETLAAPADLTEPIVAAARRLLRERVSLGGRGIRLLGVGVGGLAPAGDGQRALFRDPAEERARRVARATDTVRDRLGEGALTRARLVRRRSRGEDVEEASSPPTVD